MSLQANYSTVKEEDPRLISYQSLVLPIADGPASENVMAFPRSSEGPSLTFSIDVPSQSTGVDPLMMLESKVTIKFRLSASGANVRHLAPGKFALQSFPLNRLIRSTTLTVNNSQLTFSNEDCLDVVIRLLDEQYIRQLNGLTPTMLDPCQNYTKMMSDSSVPMDSNPLNWFGQKDSYNMPRGAFKPESVTLSSANLSAGANDDCDITVVYILREWVFTPLFNPLTSGQNAVYGLNKLQLSFNMDTTAKRALSIGTKYTGVLNDAVSNTSLHLTEDSKIYCRFFNYHPYQIKSAMNEFFYYDYQASVQNTKTLADQTQDDFNIQTLQLLDIPELIVIYARRPLSACTPIHTNSFYQINNINLNFGNRPNIFSNYTMMDLYNMSVENGLKNVSWKEFLQTGLLTTITDDDQGTMSDINLCGGPIIIDPKKNLNLLISETNGSSGKYTLGGTVRVKNLSGYASSNNVDIVILPIYKRIFSVRDGQSAAQVSLLTSDQVLNAIQGPGVLPEDEKKSGLNMRVDSNVMSGSGVKTGGSANKLLKYKK